MRAIKFICLIFCFLMLSGGLGQVQFSSDIDIPTGTRSVLWVGGTGPGNYSTISSAVSAASASGDVIRVTAGTYNEEVKWEDKSITLIGDGAATTIIDTGGNSDGISAVAGSYGTTALDGTTIIGFTVKTGGSAYSNTGIWMTTGSDFLVKDCILESNGASGLSFVVAKDARVINCTFKNNAKGLNIDGSRRVVVQDCNASSNKYGAYLGESLSCTIKNCYFNNTQFSIFVDASRYDNFYSNELVDSGFGFFGSHTNWTKHTLPDNNTVNGRPVRYIVEQTASTIPSGSGQVIIANGSHLICRDQDVSSSSRGIQVFNSHNITFMNITSNDNFEGVNIQLARDCVFKNCSMERNEFGIRNERCPGLQCLNGSFLDNNITSIYVKDSQEPLFLNNIFNLSYYGVWIQNCTSAILGKNTCQNNEMSGLTIESSSQALIDGGLISNNSYNGILAYDCPGIELKQIDLENNYRGLVVEKSPGSIIFDNYLDSNFYSVIVHYSSNQCIISNNTLLGNDYGLFFSNSNDTDLQNNTLRMNVRDGIYLRDLSSGMVAVNNTLDRNTNYGVHIESGCNGNLFYHNRFLSNNNGFKQAYDKNSGNDFNRSTEGNYWSDWTHPDNDRNGIVDIPYNITLSTSSKDHFPLTGSFGVPVIYTENILSINNDTPYSREYGATDIDTPLELLQWDWETNASWLGFTDQVLSGTPLLSDVGHYFVNISVSDGEHSDFTNFTVEVINNTIPEPENNWPVITTIDDLTCFEDDLYVVKYNATDLDPLDTLVWTFNTDAPFLSFNTSSRELSGIPLNEHVGSWNVNLSVSDGKGGIDHSNFSLLVINTNDDPILMTPDAKLCYEDSDYFNDYEAVDPDPTNDTLLWELGTNAPFLTIDELTGNLSGRPSNKHVGVYWVNISVKDGKGGMALRSFNLTVLNVNDPPEVVKALKDVSIQEDTSYTGIFLPGHFEDIDGDKLSYSSTTPEHLMVDINSSGHVRIIPVKDWNGVESVTFYANDTYTQTPLELVVTVLYVNDAPHNAHIELPDGLSYKEGDSIEAVGSCIDADIIYGDIIVYRWYSNISGFLGTGEVVNFTVSPGHHKLELNVSDVLGDHALASRTVFVEDLPDHRPNWTDPLNDTSNTTNNDTEKNSTDDVEDDDTGPGGMDQDEMNACGTWIWIFFFLMIAVVIVLLFVLISNVKKDRERREEIRKSGLAGTGSVDYWEYERWKKGRTKRSRGPSSEEDIEWEFDEGADEDASEEDFDLEDEFPDDDELLSGTVEDGPDDLSEDDPDMEEPGIEEDISSGEIEEEMDSLEKE